MFPSDSHSLEIKCPITGKAFTSEQFILDA